MKAIIKLLVVVITILILDTGCKKYPDGPTFSVLSKKSRIENTWKVEKAEFDNTDVTADYSGYVLQLKQDGTYKATLDNAVDIGRWELSKDGSNILMLSDTQPSSEEYRIMRLKNKELWLRYTTYNFKYTFIHYVPN